MKDWESRKRKIFEELGVTKGASGSGGANREGEARLAGQKAAMRSKSAFEASVSLILLARSLNYTDAVLAVRTSAPTIANIPSQNACIWKIDVGPE